VTAPDWLADAVFYQIFPERFANADPSLDPQNVVPWGSTPTPDNFFGGDLQGIVDHLDHIVALGANALYLTPIFEADTNHRYDAKDYFSIDHRLGTLETFHTLIAECHARGIRIVLDAVLNHCGDGHWAFADVVENEADSAYVNWFSVEGFPVTAHPTPNYRTCSGCYYLPKWNAYNPEVRHHHLDVARYWIDQGIDGWRLDVPYFINHTFWREFRTAVKGKSEDLYIVAEEWRSPVEWLQGDTADGTMNYTARDLILGFTADGGIDASALAAGLNALHADIPAGFHRGMLNLLGSHDTERVLTRHAGDVEAALLSYALLFSLEGAPMVYYGDEVGLTGDNDPGCRGAMPWNEESWNTRLLDGIRTFAAFRAHQPAMRRGRQTAVALDADTIAIVRSGGDERAAVIVHRGEGTTVDTASIPELAPLDADTVVLGPLGTASLGTAASLGSSA